VLNEQKQKYNTKLNTGRKKRKRRQLMLVAGAI